jgi:hypothetical protein
VSQLADLGQASLGPPDDELTREDEVNAGRPCCYLDQFRPLFYRGLVLVQTYGLDSHRERENGRI